MPLSPPADMDRAVEAFLDYLQVECGLAENTRKAYRRDLALLAQHLARARCRALRDVRPHHVEDFLARRAAAGKSPASIARHLAAVRTFCRFCVLERLMERDPSAAVEPPKRAVRLPGTLSREAVRTLLDCPNPEHDAHWLRDRAMLALLYATGMRASELAGLKVGDANFDLGVVRVLGKGNKERIVPAAERALQRLRDYLSQERPPPAPMGGQDAPAMFLSRSGRALAREDVFRIVAKYVRRSAVGAGATPHTLRHAFATHLLAGGADLRSLQEMLGHADIATTQVYTHVDASRLKAIHRKYHPRA